MPADKGSSQVHRAHREFGSTTFRHVIPCALVALATLAACSSSTSRTLSATTTLPADGTTSTVVDAAAPTVASDVASTAAATSLAPTTLVAETVAPATVAPETVAPATLPPVTAAPTTAPPVTAPVPTTVPCRVVGEFPGNYYELNFSLRRGDCGPAVRTLQTYLNDVYGFSLGVDGRFGPATASAVRDMQTRFFGAGSLVTGVLDRDTWTAMVGSDPPPEA